MVNQPRRPVFGSFQQLSEMCDHIVASSDAYATKLRAWMNESLFVMGVSRDAAHSPIRTDYLYMREAMPLSPRHVFRPAGPKFYDLLTGMLLAAEKEGRILYGPDCSGWEDLRYFLDYNGHTVELPVELRTMRGKAEWDHHSVLLVIERAGQFRIV